MYPGGRLRLATTYSSSARTSLHLKNDHLQVLSKRANVDVSTHHRLPRALLFDDAGGSGSVGDGLVCTAQCGVGARSPACSGRHYGATKVETDEVVATPHAGSDTDQNPSVDDLQAAELTHERKQQLIRGAHAGHWGVQVTYQNLRMTSPLWKNAYRDVHEYVNQCGVCCRFRAKEVRDVYIGYKSEKTGDVVHLDFCRPLPGGKNFLVAIDSTSRWLETRLASGPHAKAVVSLLNDWTKKFPLKRVFSDNGRAFASNAVQDRCRRQGVSQTFAPTYCPHSNALAERANAKIIDRLRKSGAGRNVHQKLQWATKEINRSYCRTFGTSAQALATKRDRRGRRLEDNERQYLWQTSMVHRGRQTEEMNRRLMRRYHFKKKLQIGQRVLVWDPMWKQGQLEKLGSMWTGPYTVTNQLSRTIWEVERKDERGVITKFPVHPSQVREYKRKKKKTC